MSGESAKPLEGDWISRREFVRRSALAAAGLALGSAWPAHGQIPGERPARPSGIEVLLPRERVPVALIIDDSTCLVNLNKFAVPQFDAAWGEASRYRQYAWRQWPDEIPDAFVRKFGEWCAQQGVKGKYSIVPYPACVGRLDRTLPGWSQQELKNSLELVRSVMMPHWDIHPELITHTRVIDTRTGHPYPEYSLKFMENWDWTTGRSADEIADYQVYALRILNEVGLSGEGITTPGGFGSRARPQLAQATLQAVREVCKAEIPHYFRDLYDSGEQSVAPLVQLAGGLDGPDPRCVVSIIGCTGDWTGGWDNTPPGGADKFISQDLQTGRMVEVIRRGEPAIMVCHWTGIYWNGQETGFRIFQQVVRRLHARFDNLIWMKPSEVARYWAARELTRIDPQPASIEFHAPFACPSFTLRFEASAPAFSASGAPGESPLLQPVGRRTALRPGTWYREGKFVTACVDLPKGVSRLKFISQQG